MKRTFYVLLAIVVLFVGIGFALHNKQLIEINYYFGLRWNGPLSLALLTAFALGAIAGWLGACGWWCACSANWSKRAKKSAKWSRKSSTCGRCRSKMSFKDVLTYMIFCRKDAKAQRNAQDNETQKIFALAPLRQAIFFRAK